jgi:hypothetical protein
MFCIDPKCLNCMGTTGKDKGTLLNLIKVACINYKSSKIQIE